MYIRPFPPCGSNGVIPRPHTASVTIRAHGGNHVDSHLDFAPDPPSQGSFDIGQFTQNNQPTFREIPIETTQMA